ncbi:hypothetical protein [Streptomyces sp. V2I9]|uniref:hypothetical protein n=1 Tax=Streptomyces sp. V2I9 TaxID=3042304 RepID=UPI00278A7FAC|nr:hypothetical protein [Streptomyces sp. V2I9]MDQ0985890.1 hypothetical protein [Streptomyces sp. V2I9]
MAVILAAAALAALTVVMMTGNLVWIAGQLASSVVLYGAAAWLVLPWFRSLPSRWRRRITTTPLVLYGLLVASFAYVAFTAAPEDKGGAGSVLILIWFLHTFYGTFEPTDFPLERLRRRLVRAMYGRVVAMAMGALGLIWYVHWQQNDPKFDTVLFGMVVTIAGTTTAAALKVHLRFRRLTTSLNRHVQLLLRALEDLGGESEESERNKLRSAARRSWDSLHELLSTNIDTGFKNGTFVLPPASVREVEGLVMAAVAVPDKDGDEFQEAVGALRTLQVACAGRIDPLA